MIRVLEEDLELMPYPSPWGSGRWSYNGIPFTGIAFENWEGTQILMNESEYIDGYEDGIQREYHQNGQVRIEYYKKNDFVYNYMKKWNDQGILIYHVEYDEFGNMTNAILY